jgi:hypothetical protein
MPALDTCVGLRNRWLVIPEEVCDMAPVDVSNCFLFTSRLKIYRIQADRLLPHLTHLSAVVRKLLTTKLRIFAAQLTPKRN